MNRCINISNLLALMLSAFLLTACSTSKKQSREKYDLPILSASTYDLHENGIDFVGITRTELIPVIEEIEKSVRTKNFLMLTDRMSPAYRKQLAKFLGAKNTNAALAARFRKIYEEPQDSPYADGFRSFFNLPEDFWEKSTWAIQCWAFPQPKKEDMRFIIYPYSEKAMPFTPENYGYAFRLIFDKGKLLIVAEDFGFGELVPFHSSPH